LELNFLQNQVLVGDSGNGNSTVIGGRSPWQHQKFHKGGLIWSMNPRESALGARVAVRRNSRTAMGHMPARDCRPGSWRSISPGAWLGAGVSIRSDRLFVMAAMRTCLRTGSASATRSFALRARDTLLALSRQKLN